MIGVVLVVGSWFGALLKGNLGKRRGSSWRSWRASSWPRWRSTFSSRPRRGRRSRRPDLVAYRGLGTWVHITTRPLGPSGNDGREDEGARRAHALLETGNYRRDVERRPPVRPGALHRRRARAREIKVVAWTCLAPVAQEGTAAHARGDQLPHSERGDVRLFALDIEASNVKDVGLRNRRLRPSRPPDLGTTSPLVYRSAPSPPLPAWHAARQGYWRPFPYADLVLTYDVFLPMGYFSYRPTDLGGAYGYTRRNIALIRRATGNPDVPDPRDRRRGQRREHVAGERIRARHAGLRCHRSEPDDFTTTVTGGWKYLRSVRVKPGAPKSGCF